MYIKIKHLKYAALSLSCVFFASHAYSTYVKADDAQINTTLTLASDSNSPLTVGFAEDLKNFVNSKGNQAISTTDLNSFVGNSMANKIGPPITMETLPVVDTSKIKIIDQAYPNLNADDKKRKIQEDSNKYLTSIIYLLISNSPRVIITRDDFNSLYQDFLSNIATILTTSSNFAYFSEYGNRLAIFLDQANALDVPASMLDMHVKFLRITLGFLALRDTDPSSLINDPLYKVIFISKIKDLSSLTADFFENDFNNYLQKNY